MRIIRPNAADCVAAFESHLVKVLKLVSDERLNRSANKHGQYVIGFRNTTASIRSRNLGELYFYFNQALSTISDSDGYHLKTESYSYAIGKAPWKNKENAIFRWDHHPPSSKNKEHPAYHFHIRSGNYESLHIPTGRVPIEEVVRFILNDLGVKKRDPNWHQILRDGEKDYPRFNPNWRK